MADFEADVPEEVEHVLDEFLESWGEFGGCAWQQEEDVDVGAWVQCAASVAAGCDESDGESCAFAGVESGFENRANDGVDEGSTCLCDFDAASPCAMVQHDAVFLELEKSFVEIDAFGGRKLAFLCGFESLLRVFGKFFQVIEHRGGCGGACLEMREGQAECPIRQPILE